MRHTAIILLAAGATAFSPPRCIVSRSAAPGWINWHVLPISLASVAKEDHQLGKSVHSERSHAKNAQNNMRYSSSAMKKANNDDVSKLEQLVSDMRGLYSDLEHGGGTIRRCMNAVSFTYVAPAHEELSQEDDRQLNGAWRTQVPTTYGPNDSWKEMHRNILGERMDDNIQTNSKPPPLLIYMPGLDGFGISATAQFDDLSSAFEFWRMTIDKTNNDQLSFSDLVQTVVKFVEDATSSSAEILVSPRELILVGESFGGLLTCAVAMALTGIQSDNFTLKGLALANPATSFDETNWEQFVPLLTSLRYLETQEEIANESGSFRLAATQRLPTPYSVLGGVALAATIPDSKQFSSILNVILKSSINSPNESILSASSDGFRVLAEFLPAATLERRVLQWLPVGTSVVNSPERLSKLNVPTLIIGGSDDNMLPTKEDTDRLGKLLPDCVKMDITGSGHFVLDTRVNLTEVLLDSHIDPFDTKEKQYDPISDWKLPPDHVVEAVIKKRVGPQREMTSPAFFSTNQAGKRRRGLSHVPSTKTPLLIVGNHQLYGQDLGLVYSELLEERGIIARGLAHPASMNNLDGGGGWFGSDEPKVRKQKRRWDFSDNPLDPDLFKMFGAVEVSPRNFYRLLQTQQTVLLFPGGVKEALHSKGEDYKLFWPEKTDFVRIAAKFNATIVPLSAIGAADSANIILDPPEILKLPFGIGNTLENASSSTISARYDVRNEDELFIPPLAVPKPILARHYFLFGKTYDTTSLDPKDLDACKEMYKSIEGEIKHDIQALLDARKDDPYALDGIRRTVYQRIFGRDPPTFPLKSLAPSCRKA